MMARPCPYTTELHALAFVSTATALMWVPCVVGGMSIFGIQAPISNPGPGAPSTSLGWIG